MDPNASISEDNDDVVETKEACDTLNATMCDSNVRSDFFMCMDFEWTKMQCDGDNVCMDRDGKTACVSQEIANKPLESCKVANATRCSESDVKGFQICIDNYWTDSSCSDDNYCLFRGDQALCVDKATAEAPVLPCKTANATRCVTDGEPVFQICYDNFWMNSTCDSNYVCGMKQGNAQCHDPEVPLIDMPDEPCSVDKAMQCVSGNETIYQVCSNKIWMSLTCDAGNVCRVQDDKVVCADKNNSDNNGAPRTLFAPEAFVAKGGAGSLFGMYSWGTAALICVSTLAFGVSI
ncbi:hypothetical protein GGI07_004541 [Coemansia sp. Benny D115]|nr:hypothetical protein GGI07_004541 [Coemansia sp. Benny D115]